MMIHVEGNNIIFSLESGGNLSHEPFHLESSIETWQNFKYMAQTFIYCNCGLSDTIQIGCLCENPLLNRHNIVQRSYFLVPSLCRWRLQHVNASYIENLNDNKINK